MIKRIFQDILLFQGKMNRLSKVITLGAFFCSKCFCKQYFILYRTRKACFTKGADNPTINIPIYTNPTQIFYSSDVKFV